MKILIKKLILEKFRLRRAFSLLYFYCLFTWSEKCTAIQVSELPSQQSPLLFHIISFASLLTLDGSSHLIGSNFKTNYSLEPLKTCPYYCVPYLWEIFVLIWFLQCSNKIVFPSVYDFRIMILSAAIVCFETFTHRSEHISTRLGFPVGLFLFFIVLCILKKLAYL